MIDAGTIREKLDALAASDRSLRRFGAAAHRYSLHPPSASSHPLPADLAEFVANVGRGGAGPGYGFLGIDKVTEKGLIVAHLGCGYAAVVADSGEVWIDAAAIGVSKPIAASFTAWYLDWIDHMTRNTLPEAHVPADVCTLPNALSGFLGVREQELGLETGTLAGAALREALGELAPHSIEIGAEASVIYPDGTRVDPCMACVRLIESLGPDGLRPDVVRPA